MIGWLEVQSHDLRLFGGNTRKFCAQVADAGVSQRLQVQHDCDSRLARLLIFRTHRKILVLLGFDLEEF